MINGVQMFLIRWILEPLSRVKKIIPDGVWKVIAVLSMMGMFLIQLVYRTGMASRYLVVFIPFCLFLGLFIMAGLKPNIKPAKFSPLLVISWFGVAVFAFVTGLLSNHDCLADAMLWLVAFPVFFIVWGNRSLDEFVRPIMIGAYTTFVFCMAVNLCFSPVKAMHYSGMFVNSNGLAMYATTVYVVGLIDMLSQKRFGWRVLLADLVMGLAVMTVLYTNSRAGIYVMVITTVCGMILLLTSKRVVPLKFLVNHLVPAVLTVTIVISCGAHIVNASREFGKFLRSLKPQETTVVTKPDKEKEKVDENTVTQELVDNILNYNKDRLAQGQDGDLNSFTTGRVELWKIHLKEVGLLGNPANKVLYDEDGDVETRSAHMTLIQIAYEYGALAAVFFLIFNIVSGLKAVAYVFKKPDEKYALFPVLIAIAYGAYYLVEKIMSPVTILVMLLYMMSQAFVIGHNDLKVEK